MAPKSPLSRASASFSEVVLAPGHVGGMVLVMVQLEDLPRVVRLEGPEVVGQVGKGVVGHSSSLSCSAVCPIALPTVLRPTRRSELDEVDRGRAASVHAHVAQRPRMAKWWGSMEKPSLVLAVRARPRNSSSGASIVAPHSSQMKWAWASEASW